MQRSDDLLLWRVPFTVVKLEKWWCVVERRAGSSALILVAHWETRAEAREAARQLNREERRG
jgi:hypothetical protein